MKRIVTLAAALACLFLVSFGADAQTLRAVLTVSPRPDPYLANWARRQATATIVVTNTGASTQGKFKVEVSKDGNVVARTKTANMTVLTFPPGVSTWNAEDMIPFNYVDFLGTARTTAVQTGQLPGGNYSFCVDILNPAGSQSLIGTEICKPFFLTSYQVPSLLLPLDQSALTQSQRPTLRWTALSPQPPYGVRYQVLVFEVMPGQQPMQAYRGNQPILNSTVTGVTQLLWPLNTDLPGRVPQYIWTVRSLDDQGNPVGDPDGYAQPFTFTVTPPAYRMADTNQMAGGRQMGGGEPNGRIANPPPPPAPHLLARQDSISPGQPLGGNFEAPHIIPPVNFGAGNPQPPASACSNAPPPPVIVNPSPASRTAASYVDSMVTVGSFPMKILTASGTTTTLVGTGSILVTWLHTPIAVEFTNLSVDSLNRVYAGEVTTQLEATPDALPKKWGLNIVGNISWTKSLVKKLNTWLHANFSKQVGNLDLNTQVANATNTPLKLPLGINNLKGYTVAISEMKFTPTGAELVAVAAFPIPDANDTLGFKAEDVPCTPSGPKTTAGKLGLLEDQVITGNINPSNTYVITIKAMDTTSGTFVEWDCDGFRQLSVAIDVAYPRSWLVPLPDPDPTKRVHSLFSTVITDWNDWIINATLGSCTIAHTNGAELNVSQMAYDHSDTRNPTGIVFPDNCSGDSDMTFRGFYIKYAMLSLPDKLRSFDNPNQKINISTANLILNHDGLTGTIRADNILNFPRLNVSNLGASIDTARLILLNGSVTEAAILGRIVLPVTDTTEPNAINYKALFSSDSGFTFALYPSGPITAKLWHDATFTLAPTSTLSLKINGSTRFDLDLSGDFEWAHANIGPVKDVTMGMSFEDLTMGYDVSSNVFNFSPGTWAFASPSKSMHGFPITIDKIGYVSETKQPGEILRGGLQFTVIVNLDQNKIGGKATMEVIGAISKPNGKFVPAYKGMTVSDISIYAHLAAVTLDGSVHLYSGDPTYGTGYKGTIQATFNSIKLQITSRLQFGSTAYQNNNTTFRYWYVDAKVILPPSAGIPIFTGFALYGGGLGAWSHMNVANFPAISPVTIANANASTSDTASGATYTPDHTISFGLKVVGVIGTSPTPKTFNADATLSGQFSQSGGLASISFALNVWAAAELTDRANAPVYGSAVVSYVPPDKIFDLSAAITFKYPVASGDAVRGNNIALHLHVDAKQNKWYFKLGEPTHLNTITVLNAINCSEYLMFGNDINPPTGFMDNTNNELHNVGVWTTPNVSISNQAHSGTGFAMGLSVSANTGTKDFDLCGRLHLQYGAGAGFEIDLSLLKYANNVSCGGTSPIGMRGWYIHGGVAAWCYCWANLHIAPKTGTWDDPCFWCCHHNHPNGCDFTLASFKAGAWVTAGFPNPTWVTGFASGTYNVLDGLVSGSFTVNVDVGTPCEPQPPADPAVVYTQEDAAADQAGTLVINADPDNNATNIPSDRTVRVLFGFTPNQAFDVQERQTDGSLKYRTFQARYTVQIDSLSGLPQPIPPVNMGNQNLRNQNDPAPPPPGPHGGQVGGYNVQLGGQHAVALPGPPTQIILACMPQPNVMGQYEYYRIVPGNQPVPMNHAPIPALQDSTHFKLSITGQLWELVNNAWVQAKKRNNTFVTQVRTSYFNTSKRSGPYFATNQNLNFH